MNTIHAHPDSCEQSETDCGGVVHPAHTRAAEFGFCPVCLRAGQYVQTHPGAGLCLHHHVSGKRPEKPPAAPGPPPATVPARTQLAPQRPPGAPRGGKFTGPPSRRRHAAPLPDGRFTAPHTIKTLCALPSGSRRAHNLADALAALEGVEQLLELRGDRQATTGEVWAALVARADRRTRTVTVAWADLESETGRSRATIGRTLRWLRDVGLLGVVATGASKGALGGQLNRIPTYVLAVPALPVDESEPPTGAFSSVGSPHAHARDKNPDQSLRSDENLNSTPKTPAKGPDWKLSAVPLTRRDQLEACERLRWDVVTLRPASARMLRHLLRDVFAAGWSPRDVLYALDHRPSGEAWRYAGMPRVVAAWIGFRLAAWRNREAGWLPSRAQQSARRPCPERVTPLPGITESGGPREPLCARARDARDAVTR